MKVYLLNAYTYYEGFEILGIFDTEELAELEKNRLLGIDIDLGYGPDYYLIEEFEVKGDLMFDNFNDAMEEAVFRASLDGKIYGLVQKVDKIVVRIVRESVPNKFMWTTRRVK